MAFFDITSTADLVENWYKQQYIREVQTLFSLETMKPGRLSMIYSWRVQPHISVWKALPDETRPTTWSIRKPTLARLTKQAGEAWNRCDKLKAEELYYMWTHQCQDPYYCPMHGSGSD